MSTRVFLPLLLLFFVVPGAVAEVDEITRLTLEDLGAFDINDGSAGARALENEAYVRSARLSRGNVQVLQKNKSFDAGGPGATTQFPEYLKVYEVSNGDRPPLKFAAPMSAEDVERIRVNSRTSTEAMADGLDAYADGLVQLGGAIESEMGSEAGSMGLLRRSQLTNAFLGGEDDTVCRHLSNSNLVLGSSGNYSETWAVGVEPGTTGFSPMVFLAGPTCMLRAMSDRLDNYEEEDEAVIAARQGRDNDMAASSVEYVGTDSNDGGAEHHVAMNGLSIEQVGEDGTKTTIHSIQAWIDAEYFVRTRTRMEGVMEANGETREFFLEKAEGDFRHVPNSTLYEPYREVLRMGGMLSPEQRAQMAEAKQKLDEFERQLASMPASQRVMMESMMGSQMQQMRSLVDDGTFEIEMITTSIIVNPDFGAGRSDMPAMLQTDLVRTIQRDLLTLGYDPGNTSGELSKQTVVAITKFEAANGMEVTGQATPQLAGILSAAVDASN